MSKYCPIVGHQVVYLECLECENRICEKKLQNKTSHNTQNEKGKHKNEI